MLLKVAQDDVISFKNNHKCLKNHPVDSLIFKDPTKIWKNLKSTYETDFKNLVYGNFPNEIKLLKTLLLIQERIATICWKIKIENE